ncbi:hypothetical protein K503DRAFT_767986 [Rhizopogon vinicolor AM-OR11-026]|uniref:Uncharacterized protein n=1 Tax=Rhizopogon vinicolor AM-OR11-026 TaxID=1314800 RepID=A0A1B7N8E9_9AGAM|nr:hypothetical protein K503DRAFT_767986 [Rhizopogon vinicolor AM-OR11-026]
MGTLVLNCPFSYHLICLGRRLPESIPTSATTDENWWPFVAESDSEGPIRVPHIILTKQCACTPGR